MGNKKDQATKIITARGILEHKKLGAGTQCFACPDIFAAWELDYNQQAKDEKTGRYTQFVSSLNKKPLKIYQNRPQLQSQPTRNIAAQQFDEKLVQIHKQQQQQIMVRWLGIIVLALALIVALIVLVYVRK